jgi:hypothetical protein
LEAVNIIQSSIKKNPDQLDIYEHKRAIKSSVLVSKHQVSLLKNWEFMKTYKLYSDVILLQDIPEEGLSAGDVGNW